MRGLLAIDDFAFFHGILPREEITELLQKSGDFIIIVTEPGLGKQTYVVSVRSEGAIRHFPARCVIVGSKKKVGLVMGLEDQFLQYVLGQIYEEWTFGGMSFQTPGELVLYYYANKLPLTPRSGVIIRKPVKRKWWELDDKDIELMEGIGRGEFGKVRFLGISSVSESQGKKVVQRPTWNPLEKFV